METLEDHVVRGRLRPLLALALAGSVLGVPALLLAHNHVVAARVVAGPAPGVTPAERPVPAPTVPTTAATTTTAVPATTVAPVTTVVTASIAPVLAVATRPVVAVASYRVVTTTTVRRRPPTTVPPPPTTVRPPPPTLPPLPPRTETGAASWYSGPAGDCAHPYLPLGTVITVTDLATGISTTCRVGGRGPFGGGFIVDLDAATFARLAPLSAGVIDVRLSW